MIKEICPRTKWDRVDGNIANENNVNRIQIIDLCEFLANKTTIKHNEIILNSNHKLDAHCDGK